MKIIDISKDVMTCEVSPGDPTPSLERVKTIDDECAYNLSKINMCLHNGTHMDAPLHFLPNGSDITEFDPEVFLGPCVVVEVKEEFITGAFVEEYFPRNATRILRLERLHPYPYSGSLRRNPRDSAPSKSRRRHDLRGFPFRRREHHPGL